MNTSATIGAGITSLQDSVKDLANGKLAMPPDVAAGRIRERLRQLIAENPDTNYDFEFCDSYIRIGETVYGEKPNRSTMKRSERVQYISDNGQEKYLNLPWN